MKHGLTLGKFAPLHHGHQLVIETALNEMDKVTVIIYDCPETTPTPLNIRANWLRKLYPQLHLIEAWDGPTEVSDTPGIKQKHEDYVIKKLKVQNVTHFYSSEFYGEHMSMALGAINRMVDRSRETVPISGKQIRQDTFRHRDFIHPIVYKDLITNVVFLGAPSTGKTTIAERMAQEFHTIWMPEYGREYWERHQKKRRLTQNQLVEIAEGHLEREESLLCQANTYLFTDTNAITTFMFSRAYHQRAKPRLAELAKNASLRYDITFLCDTDIPYENSWDRSGDANRLVFQKQIVGDLLERKIPFFILRGNLEERVGTVKSILQRVKKYDPLTAAFSIPM